MSDSSKEPFSISSFTHRLDRSAILTIIGVILLFSTSIVVTLIAPRYVDPTWTSPSSPYQVQMYEVEDPYLYISSSATKGAELQHVRHLKKDFTLLAFKESENLRFVSPDELKKYVTIQGENKLKLTSRLLLLREPEGSMKDKAALLHQMLQEEHSKSSKKIEKIGYQILELFDPDVQEAFSIDRSVGLLQNWVDKDFEILDDEPKQVYHKDYGVVYVQNPIEFRISQTKYENETRWRYDPNGNSVENIKELTRPPLQFISRKELISLGEHLYAIEGCWYCHTEQTRTLIQDTVLNGSALFPAPPSSPNEYIYQKITFPGTRRIGPDISRVGVKRPNRDWHKSHFWWPKTASPGSIMPAFQHFFDADPRGSGKNTIGIPNYKFEALYQYLMTKGTRITPPTQAWWTGNDPVKTIDIIEGKRKLP